MSLERLLVLYKVEPADGDFLHPTPFSCSQTQADSGFQPVARMGNLAQL
jgi:hypothetical protein